MDDQDLVSAIVQSLDYPPAEKPRPADDHDPHAVTLAHS